jgi:hypothetical protein
MYYVEGSPTSSAATLLQVTVSTGAWSTLLTGLHPVSMAQPAHDDAGHVYVVTSAAELLTYTIGGSVTYTPFGFPSGTPITEPRLVWDPPTSRLYVAPAFNQPNVFAFNPATFTLTTLPAIPASQVNDIFCGDRSGHIYTAPNLSGVHMMQFDTRTSTWSMIPDMPFDHDDNGACTVTDDGYLYVTDGNGGHLARLQLL